MVRGAGRRERGDRGCAVLLIALSSSEERLPGPRSCFQETGREDDGDGDGDGDFWRCPVPLVEAGVSMCSALQRPLLGF